MIQLNFYLFLAICEVAFIALLISAILSVYVKRYRPYYLANTKPEMLLRKYLQTLIKQTRKFGKSLQKNASEGDPSAIKNRQHMTARLNWLILERDFAITHKPDARYWEDINKRIKSMLKRWIEIEIIKEPPGLSDISLAFDSDESDEVDLTDANIDEMAKKQIESLQTRVNSLLKYESMFNEMEMAYKTLEVSYEELKHLMDDLKLEAGAADDLREIIRRQEANEQNLQTMLDEIESSKSRLNDELHQLEDAYVALENEVNNSVSLSSGNGNSQESQDIAGILENQAGVLEALKQTLDKLKIKPDEKKEMNKHTNVIEKNNKEIGHCMQMIELERERLSEEVQHLQDQMD